MKASELAKVLSAPAPDPGGDGEQTTTERVAAAMAAASPAIDDYVGRYEVCYELYEDQKAALIEDLASGKITGEEFDELWNDVTSDFEACRQTVDEDHDMFEDIAKDVGDFGMS